MPAADKVTEAGRAIITNRLKGSGTEPKYLGWGTGSGTAAVGDTTLFTETYSTSQGSTGRTRVACTTTREQTSSANDTYQAVGTLTVASGQGSQTITNIGLFDTDGESANMSTPPSGGNLFAKSSFASGYQLGEGESLNLTCKVQIQSS